MSLKDGVKNCIEGLGTVMRTGSVWMMYVRFGKDYLMILSFTVALLSATYLGLFFLALILAGGGMLAVPLLGFGVLTGLTMISFVLIYQGLFPWKLFFTLGGGIVAPFFYVGSIR